MWAIDVAIALQTVPTRVEIDGWQACPIAVATGPSSGVSKSDTND